MYDDELTNEEFEELEFDYTSSVWRRRSSFVFIRQWRRTYVGILAIDIYFLPTCVEQTCYLMALDSCYKHLCNKFGKLEGKEFAINDVDYFVFHSPYNKLVQKSFARLLYNDFLRNASSIDEAAKEKFTPYDHLCPSTKFTKAMILKRSHNNLLITYVLIWKWFNATMFSLRLCENQSPFSLSNIASVMDVGGKLKARHEVTKKKENGA